MDIKGIIAICFGIFVVIMIALTGVFSEIIKGFTSAMGGYGFIIGVLIVIAIIAGALALEEKGDDIYWCNISRGFTIF